MKQKPILALLLVIFLYNTQNVCSQEPPAVLEEPSVNLQEPIVETEEIAFYSLKPTVAGGFIGTGEVLMTNVILMTYIHFVMKTWWALPTWESVKRHLTSPWIWENDDLYTDNQIGHPIQGAFYFTAGRVNNFNYYQSLLFAAFGSATWEAFFEALPASTNDLITTTVSALSLGEILYRLYVEAYNAGVPEWLAFAINPIAGFHRLVTRQKPPVMHRRLYLFHTYLGAGYSNLNYFTSPDTANLYFFDGYAANAGFDIIYGNPFEQESRSPFDHFEFYLSVDYGFFEYINLRIISDGYLFSFAPVYSEKHRLSTGLSLQLDIAYTGEPSKYASTINNYTNALDWTVKYRHILTEDASIQLKGHAGFTFFGVTNLTAPVSLNNYGFGVNAKRYYILENKKHYKLELQRLSYFMWNYPGTSVLKNSLTQWHFTDIIFSLYLTKNITLSAWFSYITESGNYNGVNTDKMNIAMKFLFGWRF